jgi:TRAP-type C4-dicarboxylate transport system substrate-binding protein
VFRIYSTFSGPIGIKQNNMRKINERKKERKSKRKLKVGGMGVVTYPSEEQAMSATMRRMKKSLWKEKPN